MKTIATGYATIFGLVGALALTGMNCSAAQTRAGRTTSPVCQEPKSLRRKPSIPWRSYTLNLGVHP